MGVWLLGSVDLFKVATSSEMPPPSSVPSRGVCRDGAERVVLNSRRDSLDELNYLQGGTRMDSYFCAGIDVGCKTHRVGIAHPDGSILEEFDISRCAIRPTVE